MESVLKQWTNEQTRASVAHISEEDRLASTPTKAVTFATGDHADDNDNDGAATPPRASTPTPEDDVETPKQPDSRTSTVGELAGPRPPITGDTTTTPAATTNGRLGSLYGLVRSTHKLNIDTGTTNSRECTVKVVGGLLGPMNPLERRRKEFMNKKKNMADISPKADAGRGDTQYRLRSKTNGRDTEISTSGSSNPTDKWILAESFNRYVHWSFQTSFQQLVFSLIAIFYLSTCLWGIAIYAVGYYQPNCIYVGDFDFDTAGGHFIDAYAISWSTFSTVGYGLTGPAVSDQDRCIGLNLLTATEAFLGVLYAGFAGAVIFGKVSRVQSFARVLWSDSVVIEYGSGVVEEDAATEEKDEDAGKLPCPVLEFRVANQSFDQEGGEIVNATVTVWASTSSELASESIREAANLSSVTKKKGTTRIVGNILKSAVVMTKDTVKKTATGGTQLVVNAAQKTTQVVQKTTQVVSKVAQKTTNVVIKHATQFSPLAAKNSKPSLGELDQKEAPPPESAPEKLHEGKASRENLNKDRTQMMMDLKKLAVTTKHIAMVEDPLLPPLIYSKLDIETDSHPFFKRVWMVRHKLDANSPLLSSEAHDLIVKNGGFWPAELNSYQAVRKHVDFREIMVSFNGTSNVSGSTVFSQKLYDFVDVNVGWRFANTLVNHPKTGALSVDLSLLNDVVEQKGGGAEPFTDLVDDDQNVVAAAMGEAGHVITEAADHAVDMVGNVVHVAGDAVKVAGGAAKNTAGYVTETVTHGARKGEQPDPTKEN